MPQEINITDGDIRYAEKILLPEGKGFDDERKIFIRNLETIDLQAVPGSGKTTALLAKLLILEKKLPFSDGAGILVISHTNAAIDEIKLKIQKHCPKLFSYPNYVGTIQGFVDKFLAMPMYNQLFNSKLNWINTERYQEELRKQFNLIAWEKEYDQPTKFFYGRNIKRARKESQGNKKLEKEICTKLIYKEVSGLFFDFISEEIKNNKNEVLLKDSSNKKYQGLMTAILGVLLNGTISYDYAYHLGELYLYKTPKIKEILQKRFPYVFVDEMQDMDSHQYSLLEKLFFEDGNSTSIIQRIGDKNQAIYNSVKAIDVWDDRETVLRLKGSNRLSKPIADVVKYFALYNNEHFEIVGLNQCSVKPHLLIFENQNISNVIPFFGKLVKKLKEDGELPISNNAIKVICWNTDWKEDGDSRQDRTKLRLEDYHTRFKKEKSKPKLDYDYLKDYLLFYDKSKHTLEAIKRNIINALLKILRLENVNTFDNRLYTKKNMFEFIKEHSLQKYEELNQKIYNWSIGIIRGRTNEVWDEIKVYSSEFLALFSQNTMSEGKVFINNEETNIQPQDQGESELINKYKEAGIEIEIASVHAVKGQTHCATLYLESYYYSDGGNSYESQRLSDQFLGNAIQIDNVGERVKQSAKMAYVGFSRPNNLLCIAVHKDRYEEFLQGINMVEWVVKIIPTELAQ